MKRSYWMLADTELPISINPHMRNTFEAHYKHALLFNTKLMISDAQAVNSSNFRHLIQQGAGFEKLISKDFLSIATRAKEDNSQAQSLREVRDAFSFEGKQNMKQCEFDSNDDLLLMHKESEIISYHYTSLRDNYTRKIFDIFKSEKANKIFGNEVQKILIERLNIESERDNGLGRVFLQKNFEDDLMGINQIDIWNKFKTDIIKFSDAPYVTGLPTVLDANPIYSPLHKESFELVYGQPTKIEKIGESITLTEQFELSTYQHALLQLNADDFYFLRQTDEFFEYIKLLERGTVNEREQSELIDVLAIYQERINRYVIEKRLGIKQQDRTHTKVITPLVKIGIGAGSFAFGLAVASPIAGAALAIATFMASERSERKNKERKDNYISEEKKYLKELLSTKKEKIDAIISNVSDNNETIYTSVNV